MKKTIPKKTVNVCDFCQHEGFLETCHVCGRQFCLSHQGIVGQSWGYTTLCHKCSERDDVQDVCCRYAKQLTPLFAERDDRLKRLPKRERKET